MSQTKAILWGLLFLLTGLIYSAIPSYLIFEFWRMLNEFKWEGNPVYTYALFCLFMYIIAMIVSLICFAAMVRAFVQRKNEDLGIPDGIKYFSVFSCVLIGGFMLFWYFFAGELAFFALKSP